MRDLLRLLRILRVLKVIRHHPDSAILFKALHMSARPLVVPLTFLAIGVTFFGSFVYYFEKLVRRPRSIPAESQQNPSRIPSNRLLRTVEL